MAEQRPAFRFRLPWLLQSEPAAPPPRPTVPTQTVIRPPIPPTPTQRPSTTITQTPIPPTPAQMPPTTTTTQTPISPTPTTIQTPIPAALVPRPPTITQTPIPQTPTQRPPPRPLGLAPEQPPPIAQAPTGIEPPSTRIKIPDNQTTQPPNEPPAPATPSQRPPFRPPGVAQSQPTSPQAQAPPRTESQPSSPSRVGTQLRVSSQPTSPSPVVTQSRISSQPASPSRVSTQSRVLAQSPSSSRVGSQSRAPSQPSSPSRGTIQSRTPTQPSSPSRTQPSQTGSLPRSPSRLASQPTGKISSSPSSPAKTSTTIQPTEDSADQPPSSRTLQQIGPQTTPSSFVDPKPLVFGRREPETTTPSLESQKPQPNTQTTVDTVSNTHNPHNQMPIETTTQPNVLVPTEVPTGTQKSDSTPSSADLTLLNEKPEATKEALERSTGGMAEYVETKEKTVAELIAEMSKSKAQTKEPPSFAVQTEQKQPEKQLHTKEKYTTSISNGKQIKNTTSHPMDKSPVSESRQRPVTSNGAQVPLQKEIRDDISKFVQKMATAHPKNPMDEKPVSIMTIAGDNRGASMHLGSESAKREATIHIRRGYKVNPDESSDTTTNGEESSKGKRLNNSITGEDKATKAYVNSNTQGVNNSIVFNSCIAQRNPGVNLTFTRYLPEPIKSNNKTESLEARKAEFNITPAQKLTYEPTVRRRCLRGLFLEPSESDDDNPEKPRRHGCRYSCGEKSKEGEIDVL